MLRFFFLFFFINYVLEFKCTEFKCISSLQGQKQYYIQKCKNFCENSGYSFWLTAV